MSTICFAILLRPSDYDNEPDGWECNPWLAPFFLRCGSFLRFGTGGRWGCVGIEIERPTSVRLVSPSRVSALRAAFT